MTAEEVKALPVDQKIRIMEAIWEDFRDRFDRMEIPQETKDHLDERRARARAGKAQLSYFPQAEICKSVSRKVCRNRSFSATVF